MVSSWRVPWEIRMLLRWRERERAKHWNGRVSKPQTCRPQRKAQKEKGPSSLAGRSYYDVQLRPLANRPIKPTVTYQDIFIGTFSFLSRTKCLNSVLIPIVGPLEKAPIAYQNWTLAEEWFGRYFWCWPRRLEADELTWLWRSRRPGNQPGIFSTPDGHHHRVASLKVSITKLLFYSKQSSISYNKTIESDGNRSSNLSCDRVILPRGNNMRAPSTTLMNPSLTRLNASSVSCGLTFITKFLLSCYWSLFNRADIFFSSVANGGSLRNSLIYLKKTREKKRTKNDSSNISAPSRFICYYLDSSGDVSSAQPTPCSLCCCRKIPIQLSVPRACDDEKTRQSSTNRQGQSCSSPLVAFSTFKKK